MTMDKQIRWLRISYWAGAIIDALAAIQMLSPHIFGLTNQLPNFNPGHDFTYAMGMGASLMLGWTALLLWADRKPLERKGILIITVVPVIVGIAIAKVVAVSTGFTTLGSAIPTWALQTVLIVLFTLSYRNARRVETRPDR
jgi:hypothetical protein